MKRYASLAALVAAGSLGLSLLGGVHRAPALAGASIASFTAMVSLAAMGRLARGARKPIERALIGMTAVFLVRLLLVAAGTALVAKAGASVFAFVLGFFVPYFGFAAIEAAFLHSLPRSGGVAA